jgi:hypothetical protein
VYSLAKTAWRIDEDGTEIGFPVSIGFGVAVGWLVARIHEIEISTNGMRFIIRLKLLMQLLLTQDTLEYFLSSVFKMI